MKLKDKVAIVTGSSNGIGKAIAVGFAKEGAKVTICYYGDQAGAEDTLRLVEEAGSEGLIFKMDISKREDNERVVEETVKRFGKLDILVNNAGARDQAPILEVSPELWKHAVDSNLGGLFWAMKAAVPYMRKQGGGKIINVASIQGVRPCNSKRTCYGTTKRGIIAMTRAAAAELGPDKIYVNAISPGTVETNMGGLKQLFTEEVIKERCKYIPLRYRGKTDEMVGPAVFLASDDSSYVTGTNLVADGGWCATD